MNTQNGAVKAFLLGILALGLSNCTKARLSAKKQEFLSQSAVLADSAESSAATPGSDGASADNAGGEVKQDGQQIRIPTGAPIGHPGAGEGGGTCARSNDPAIQAVVNAINARASVGDRPPMTSSSANGFGSCSAALSKFVVRTVSAGGESKAYAISETANTWFGADCQESPTNYVGTAGRGLARFGYFSLEGDMYFCASTSSAESCSPSSPSFVVGIQLGETSSSSGAGVGNKDSGLIRNIVLAGGQRVATNPDCEQREASPLLLQLSDEEHSTQPIALSSRLEGVLFDILGLNSDPVAHAKKRISWLLPGSRDTNYFLVLPNARGQVNGIDELFGDNTLGPDGRFAANGYEALRKHETVHDGLIDAQDEVFTRLRLWHDLNGDGVAQTEELKTLGQKHVKAIDLDYDTNYQEVDSHGNKVKMKSVVIMDDDSLNLVFDIWFKIR